MVWYVLVSQRQVSLIDKRAEGKCETKERHRSSRKRGGVRAFTAMGLIRRNWVQREVGWGEHIIYLRIQHYLQVGR